MIGSNEQKNSVRAMSFGELCERSQKPSLVLSRQTVVNFRQRQEEISHTPYNRDIAGDPKGGSVSFGSLDAGIAIVTLLVALAMLLVVRALAKHKQQRKGLATYETEVSSQDGVPLRTVSIASADSSMVRRPMRSSYYKPIKKLPSSTSSLCSNTSISTMLTNGEVDELHEHSGYMVASAHASALQHSTPSSVSNQHGVSSTELETTSFHRRVETLLQSLAISDSEDDDTDDDSLSHFEIGHDSMDFNDIAVDERRYMAVEAGKCKGDVEKSVIAATPNSSSIKRRSKKARRLAMQARKDNDESVDLADSKTQLARKPSRGLRFLAFQSRRQKNKETKSPPEALSVSALIKSYENNRLSCGKSEAAVSQPPPFSSEGTTAVVSSNASNKSLTFMERRKQDLVSSLPSETEESSQVTKQRFLEAAAAALDIEDYSNEPQTSTPVLPSSRRSAKSLQGDDSDEEVDLLYGITKYFQATPERKYLRKMSREKTLSELESEDSDSSELSIDSRSLHGEKRLSITWSATSSMTLRADTGLLFDDEASECSTFTGPANGKTIITNIAMVERLCTTDAHRRKMKKARLVVRVVLGQHRKDYKTSKACFQAIDIVSDFKEDVREAVLEKSKFEQMWTDLKALWKQLWRAGSAASMVFPALPSDPEDVDSYDYALLLVCKIFCTLYPELTPQFKPNNCGTTDFESLDDSDDGSEGERTLFLGTVKGESVCIPLSSFDMDPSQRTRMTPYKHDRHYPLSLQDPLRVVRAILGPSHKRVSGQDCLQAIQVYGLWKIAFRRLSADLDAQRTRIVELGAALHHISELLPSAIAQSAQPSGNGGDNSLLLPDITSHIHQRLPVAATMNSQHASIVQLSEYIHQLLSEE